MYCKHTHSFNTKHPPCIIQTHKKKIVCYSLTINKNFALFSNLVAFLPSMNSTFFTLFLFSCVCHKPFNISVLCFILFLFFFVGSVSFLFYLQTVFLRLFTLKILFFGLCICDRCITLCNYLTHIQKKSLLVTHWQKQNVQQFSLINSDLVLLKWSARITLFSSNFFNSKIWFNHSTLFK